MAQGPVGSEFRVNSFTISYQGNPSVAADADGNFVVVWTSNPQDGSFLGIFGQRFSAAGIPNGTEFQVNSYTLGFQRYPEVASDPGGDFVVVWSSAPYGPHGPQDGDGYGVFGQRFDSAGDRQGTEFQVNTYTTGNERGPAIASDASGNFVVVWASHHNQDGDLSGVFGQRFDASGTRQGTEFQVNSYTTYFQEVAAVAAESNGDFVVAWVGSYLGPGNVGVFARRFGSSGTPLGDETMITGFGGGPAIASDANGAFVIAFEAYGDGSSRGIFAQHFDSAGVPTINLFLVNSYTTGYQSLASVSSDADGDFVVVWESAYQDPDDRRGIFGQRFDANAAPQESQFQVNSYTTNLQRFAAVASDPDGDFVVVWHSKNQDGAGYGIFGQRYGDLIFKDGFEPT